VVGTLSKQIMAELEKSKSCSLNDFIGSLGIKFLGRRQAEIMIGQGIDTLNKWLNLSVAALLELPGFTVEGSKAPAIVEGIRKAKPIIDGLLKAGVTIQAAEPTTAVVVEGGKLSGLVFCFTGAILKTDESGKRYTRDRMWEVVRQNGGTVIDDVKKGVSHLVQADPSSQSSKSRKAEKFGVKVISEADFWKLVE
jgi:DNA ligase (NAD+)